MDMHTQIPQSFITSGIESYFASNPDLLRSALENLLEDICMKAAIEECESQTVPKSEIFDILHGTNLQ